MKNPLSGKSENVKNLALLIAGAFILGVGTDIGVGFLIVPGIAIVIASFVMFLKNNAPTGGTDDIGPY